MSDQKCSCAAETHCANCATNLVTAPRNCALTPCGASHRSELLGRTSAHRNHCMKTGPGCTTHLHSFRHNYLTTCSNLGQVLVWEVQSSGAAEVLSSESAEVLESVQLLSALESGRQASQ